MRHEVGAVAPADVESRTIALQPPCVVEVIGGGAFGKGERRVQAKVDASGFVHKAQIGADDGSVQIGRVLARPDDANVVLDLNELVKSARSAVRELGLVGGKLLTNLDGTGEEEAMSELVQHGGGEVVLSVGRTRCNVNVPVDSAVKHHMHVELVLANAVDALQGGGQGGSISGISKQEVG